MKKIYEKPEAKVIFTNVQTCVLQASFGGPVNEVDDDEPLIHD